MAAQGNLRGRLRWLAQIEWVGERSDRNFRAFPAEPVILNGYTRINAGVEATVMESASGRPGLDLLVRVENLGDASFEEAFGFEAPGRGIYLGGRVTWSDG